MGGCMTGVLEAVTAAFLTLVVFLVLLAVAAFLARRRLISWAQRSLIEVAGPAVIGLMAPRAALHALLSRLYGDEVGHEDVLISLLGGAGRDLDARDTAVSRNASAHFRLESIDDTTCRSQATWTYGFSKLHNDHRLVIFGTHDRDIAAVITGERTYPLYELWVLNDEDELEDFVRVLRHTVQIGVTYVDGDGSSHVVEPCRQEGEEVMLGRYDQFVRLPKSSHPGDLRIVQFDLHDLADPDHVVSSIERLTLRASSNANKLGFFTWSPPFPCYVRHVAFDVVDLPWGDEKLAYTVVPSTAKGSRLAVQREWFLAEEPFRIELNSWMLAGHGVTLLWRPVDGAESRNVLPAPRRSPSW